MLTIGVGHNDRCTGSQVLGEGESVSKHGPHASVLFAPDHAHVGAGQFSKHGVVGGAVEVAAGADGLDSNGSVALTGGTITISSADNGGEGPVDANGEITLNGANNTTNGSEITSANQLGTNMGGGPGGR